jgi:hypothetical protein
MSVVIESTRYNNLVQRIVAILGNSTTVDPTTGYGTTFNVDPFGVTGSRNQINLANVDKIDSDNFKNLYIDLVRARVHQIGASAFSVEPFVVGDYRTNLSNTDKIQEAYTQGLENLMTQIETDKFEIDIASQAEIDPLTSSSRLQGVSGSWNGTLTHIFTVNFSSAADRRHFFNTGGEIRFSANLNYTGIEDKTLKWQTLLNNIGVVSFKANSTFSNAGSGSGRNLGNYQLNSSYQLVYRTDGLSPYLGPYSGNAYEIYALQNSDTQIQFRVWFIDNDIGTIDENILGDLTSTVEYARADGVVDINGVEYATVVFTGSVTASTISNL